VQGDLALESELGEGGDVVDDAVGEVGGGADEEDGVAVDEAGDGGDVDLVVWSWAGDEVDFDTEVGAGFAEGCVCCVWEDPGVFVSSELLLWRGNEDFGGVHFWLRHTTLGICLLSCAQASHEDRLCSTTCSNSSCSNGRIEHSQNHRNDLCLHLPDSGENIRMDRVRNSEHAKGLRLQFDQLFSTVIYSSRDESILPSRVIHVNQRL